MNRRGLRGGGGIQNSGRGRGRGRGYCYNQREGGGGRSSPSSTHSSSTPHSHSPPVPFGSDGSSADTPLDQRQKVSQIPRQTPGQIFNGQDVEYLSSDIGNLKPRQQQNSPVSSDGLSTPGFRFNKDDLAQSHPTARITQRWQISGPGSESHSSVNVASKSVIDAARVKDDESSLPADIAITKIPSSKETESSQTSQEKTGSIGISENSDGTSTKADIICSGVCAVRMNCRGGGDGIQNSGRGRGRGYCYHQREGGGGGRRSSPSSTHSSSTTHSLPVPFGSDGSSADTPLDQRQKVSQIPRQTSGQIFNGQDVEYLSSDIGNLKLQQNSPVSSDGLSTPGFRFNKDDFAQSHPTARITRRWQISGPGSESHSSVNVASKSVIDTACVKDDESSLPADIAITKIPSSKETESSQTSQEKTGSIGISETSDGTSAKAPFDICQEQTGSVVKLKPSLLVKNREKRKETSRAIEGIKITILRSGMILLKNYISYTDQVKIVKTCRELGLGTGGFYKPGYRDGADLKLKMMCLGKNWDPETSSYRDQRPFDLARPPLIPNEFHQLVIGAIQYSHEYLQKFTKERNVGYILPSMSPNLCIVNFYAKSGRLGLHQDKDESQLSIGRGLPVVSFSIGDSAEFLYGDQRDVEKAEKVILESGDVLIFGGKSRLIFHGIKTIIQDTAPKALREELNLRPGRLNLTFREY